MWEITRGREEGVSSRGESHINVTLWTHGDWALFVFLWLCRWSGVSVSSVILSTIRTNTRVNLRGQPKVLQGPEVRGWRETLKRRKWAITPFDFVSMIDCSD